MRRSSPQPTSTTGSTGLQQIFHTRSILLLRKIAQLRASRRVARPPTRYPKPGRNDPCPCGSGRKYKRCCAQS
ncbi:MAG TPA: SEC-C metal-binding domain-containing protein [Acetobacteraceae bacterium]|nr:SEC-C metal-binding domain-containing protein [Acetobacteraceae bacterium]